MDFLRPRAIPALIALLLPGLVHAACDKLAGTYRYFSAGKPTDSLANYADGPGGEKRKLFKYLTPMKAATPGDLASSAPRARVKYEHLAATVGFTPRADGADLEFFDAAGNRLVRLALAAGFRCEGDRLTRSEERLAGLGDAVSELRVEESFSRDADGSLVHRETTSTVGGKDKPKASEARFAPAGK